MRVQLLSDIHLEFYYDLGARFVRNLDPEGVEVLLLPGDVANAKIIRRSLGLICKHYGDAKVVYCAGNHEYYGGSPTQVADDLNEAMAENPNLVVLDNNVFEHQGVRFAGTPLWFADDPLNVAYKYQLNDFHQIRDFVPWVYDENRKAQAFLDKVAGDVDVVLTHHLPSYRCVDPQYVGSELNRFFVCDMDEVIAKHQPPLWVFGHTHTPGEWNIGDTRLVTNPRGYPNEQNLKYNPKLVFDVFPKSNTTDGG
jgi:predicted phosphodiesterase